MPVVSLVGIVLSLALVAFFLRAPDDEGADTMRVVLWGDSLAFESAATFKATVEAQTGATVLTRTWGGTAVCDWFQDMVVQLREWKPTIAVLAFSGNTVSECMQDRDVVTAYRQDASEAVLLLTSAGVQVDLVEAPPRPDQELDADGRTALDRIWSDIDAQYPRTRMVPAGIAVTDHRNWTARLPCLPNEACGPDGTVVVRSPDGVHFCPVQVPPLTECPVYSPGAFRYGTAMALAVLDYAT